MKRIDENGGAWIRKRDWSRVNKGKKRLAPFPRTKAEVDAVQMKPRSSGNPLGRARERADGRQPGRRQRPGNLSSKARTPSGR